MEIVQIVMLTLFVGAWFYSFYKILVIDDRKSLDYIIYAILNGIAVLTLTMVAFTSTYFANKRDCPKLEKVENVYRIKK